MAIADAYTLLGAWPETEIELSAHTLLRAMKGRGVSRALVSHASAIFYDSAIGNRENDAICGQHAELHPVSVLNPLRYPTCIAEAEQALAQGQRAFRLCPGEHEYPFSESVGPLRELLRSLTGASALFVDVTRLAAPVISAGVLELLPAPVVFTVDAGGLGTVLHAGTVSAHVRVETSRLTAGGAVEAAAAGVGIDRLIFGSGAPLRTLGSAVMSVQYAEFSEADRAAIFESNLAGLLGWPA